MSLEQTLNGWTGPSSDTEQEKQERTERMVRQAIEAHKPFSNCQRRVFVKGSYANNTNVRADSDVDIAVECTECIYWEEDSPGAHPSSSPYKGIWTPSKLRDELANALRSKFSASEVDTSGSTAIRIHSSSARVDADVVPCFTHKRYYSNGVVRVGTKIFKSSSGSIINYPNQQLENGRKKNQDTAYIYKKTVRILKRVHNLMVERGSLAVPLPSYFMECLPYNCPDSLYAGETWTQTVREVLTYIWNSTQGDEPQDSQSRWVEVNKCFFLFHGQQKWTRENARVFSQAAWNYLGLK